MTYSNTIPADVISYVRVGSKAELDDASVDLAAAEERVPKDRHGRALRERHREERRWADPADRYRRHHQLLDLIGRTEEEDTEAVEMDPDGHHFLAVSEALERFKRDNPGVGASEIEAFCRAVGRS